MLAERDATNTQWQIGVAISCANLGDHTSISVEARRGYLQRGRQYLREISASGEPGSFGLPRMIGGQIRSLVPWSRIFNNQEILLTINTDADKEQSAWVTIDSALHAKPGALRCLYSTDAGQIGTRANIEPRNGKAVMLRVPAGGFVIYG